MAVEADWIGAWIVSLRRANRAAATIKRRRMTARRFEAWMGTHGRSVLDATAEDVEAWLDSIRHRTTGGAITPQSRAHYLGDLAGLYRWLTKQHVVAVDPTEDIQRPTRPRYLPRPIADEDAAVALAMADPTTRLVLVLAGLAGLRCAEICSLDAGQVDRRGKVLWVVQGKGGKDRVVPICSELDAELGAATLPRHGPVVHHQGLAYSPNSMSAKVSRYLAGLGIHGGLHAWRHWFATALLDGGRDVREVQELLGHTSLQSTQVYTRVSRARLADAVGVLHLPGMVTVAA